MKLEDFQDPVGWEKETWNILFCILQKPGPDKDNRMNEKLAWLQEYLIRKKEMDSAGNLEINKAFVFGDHLIAARNFDETELSEICYVTYHVRPYHYFHALCMAVALLKAQSNKRDECQNKNILLILADTALPKQDQDRFRFLQQYLDWDLYTILIKKPSDDCGCIEELIAERGGKVYSESELDRFYL